MSAAESKLRPSLTRERKKLNSQKNGSIVFLPGTIFFALFYLQFTQKTTQTAVMMAPLAGKHESDEDELET